MAKRVALAALAFVLWFALFCAGKALIAEGIGHNRPFVFAFALVLLAAYYAVARWIERRNPTEIAARGLWLTVAGAGIGLALFWVSVALLHATAALHYVGGGPLIGGAIASFAAAIGEELLFRGFIFRWLENGAGTWIAILVSAALFGGAHALNRGATLIDVVAIGAEAGVLLSAAFVASRSLWLPIGLHFGWDFAIGTFGRDHAAVESSSVAVAVCLVTGVALLTYGQRRGRIKPRGSI